VPPPTALSPAPSPTAPGAITATIRSGALTRAGGPITVDTLWDTAIVEVTDDIVIGNGALLTIAPGVTVSFTGYYGVLVSDGAIQANGTAVARITWTTSDPDAFDETTSTTGCWNGITFLNVPQDAPSSYLHGCVFEHAKAVLGLGLDAGGPRVGGVACDGAGGALRIVGGSRVEVSGCVLRHNCADRGGALALHYGAAPLIVNTLIHDNTGWNRAGAVYVSYADPVFVHDTLAYNRCVNPEIFDRTAGAIDHYHGKPTYIGCIIQHNLTNHHEQLEVLHPKAFYTRYCDIGEFGGGVGGFDADPLFVTVGGAEGRLGPDSPCRDAGSTAAAGAWLPAIDLDGYPRIVGGLVDMGCYEYSPPTAVGDGLPNTGRIVVRAWPNPCNPTTTVRFTTERSGHVSLHILDPRGRRVRTLHDGTLPAGVHGFVWRGCNDAGRAMASGVYQTRLMVDGAASTTKLTLVR